MINVHLGIPARKVILAKIRVHNFDPFIGDRLPIRIFGLCMFYLLSSFIILAPLSL